MRYFVESYGCTTNYGEGRELSERMASLGHIPTDSADDADIVILNTCTVVETTEKKMISRMSDLRKDGKDIVVTGCMAKAQRSRITVRLPDSLIIAPEGYSDFSKMMEERYGSSDAVMIERNDQTILPIARGCLGNCTYCITKIARGDLKSHRPEHLKKRFEGMVTSGAKEILVTAQDTASYGTDIQTDLPALINDLLRTEGEYRIRIGMMNPDGLVSIENDLMDVMSDARVYRFLHIPVQSGSDDVLRRMNRKYSVNDFIGSVRRIRARYPDISISTDMISGFPGETEDDHKRSIALLNDISADTVNVTRFSPRPGTPAFLMTDKIHGRTSKERSRELTSVKSTRANERNMKMIGCVHRVLVTEIGKNGTFIGRTENYRPVVLKDVELWDFADVEITSAEPTHLFGDVIRTYQS